MLVRIPHHCLSESEERRDLIGSRLCRSVLPCSNNASTEMGNTLYAGNYTPTFGDDPAKVCNIPRHSLALLLDIDKSSGPYTYPLI